MNWLAGLLQPVLERFSSHCTSGLFTFLRPLNSLDIDPNVFMCSYDVSSLFINVLLDETIKICSEAVYDKCDSQPAIPTEVLVELTKSATSSVEFSLNNATYKQTDGVAMGSLLGPALASIFVRYHQEKLFPQTQKPPTFFRYVEDTFAIFDYEAESDEILTKLNCLHPSLKFTFNKEKRKCFLDVYVAKTDIGLKPVYTRNPFLVASVYVGSHLIFSNVK